MGGSTGALIGPFDEINSALSDLAELVEKGTVAGVPELTGELKSLITSVSGRGSVAKRQEYNDRVAELLKSAPVAVSEPADIAEVDGLEDLVALGAKSVKKLVDGSVKGGKEIAKIQLDIRRRIIYRGLPDLNAQSHVAKLASSMVYDRVTAQLPAEGAGDEHANAIRAAVNSIKRTAQTAMTDLKVEYIRSLDTSEAAERAPYAAIVKGRRKASEQIAEYYGVELVTRAEKEAARRARKAELEAKARRGALTPEEDAELSGERYLPPAEQVRRLSGSIARSMKGMDGIDLKSIKPAERKELRSFLSDQIDMLTALKMELS